MNLYSYGGIQRVLSGLLSELNKRHDVEIEIIMPYSVEDKNVFGLDSRIKVSNYFDIKSSDETPFGFIAKVLRRINKETGILDLIPSECICNKIYFPAEERVKIINYINDNNFDIVIGVGDLFTLLVSKIKNAVNCECVGWMHSTFDSYFRTKGAQCYGIFRHAKKHFANLEYLMVLNESDKVTFEKNFEIKAIKLPNPVNYYMEMPTGDIKGPIIFVGRMEKEHKGLDYLVDIIDKLHASYDDLRFVVIGGGYEKEWLDTEIINKRLDSVVELPGMISNIEDYLCKGSIFIHTSRWEGFGVVILEAMAFGLPVVAFHNNGPDEIITDGRDGYLIEKFDCNAFVEKIEKLLADEDLYMNMSVNANNRAKDFSKSKIADKLYNILQQGVCSRI